MYIKIKDRPLYKELISYDDFPIINEKNKKSVYAWLDQITLKHNFMLSNPISKNNVEMKCTYCNATHTLKKQPKLKDFIKCPQCKKTFKHHRQKYASSIRSYEFITCFLDYNKENELFIRFFRTYKNISSRTGERTYFLREEERIKYNYELCFTIGAATPKLRPAYSKKCFQGFNSYLYRKNVNKLMSANEFKYSCIDILVKNNINFNVNLYLIKYLENPKLELFIKSGLYQLVADITNGAHSNRYYNRNYQVVEIFQMIRKNKIILDELNKSKISIADLIIIDKFEIKTKREFEIMTNRNLEGRFVELLKFVKRKQLFNYLENQIESGTYYYDYLIAAKSVGENMTHNKILFPENLIKAHDDAVRKKVDLKNKKLDEDIKKRYFELEKYIFETKKYFIKPVKSQQELIDESEALNHCVKQYASRVASGTTNIMFIREVSNKAKPLYTLEFSDNKIQQVRGNNNKPLDKSAKFFVSNWAKKYKLLY